MVVAELEMAGNGAGDDHCGGRSSGSSGRRAATRVRVNGAAREASAAAESHLCHGVKQGKLGSAGSSAMENGGLGCS